MPSAISDYALIGDGRTCALVSKAGSIDFLCWPRFDSDACFAALLGDESHGHWTLAPSGYVTGVSRRYRGDTLVLETDVQTDAGAVRITDFMPWHDGPSAVVRRVQGLGGRVPMHSAVRLRFDYGRMAPWLQVCDGVLCGEVGPDRVTLRGPPGLSLAQEEGRNAFVVEDGQTLDFVLTHSDAALPEPAPLDPAALLQSTLGHWSDWIGRFDKPCRWPGAVKRSLITLKAMVDRKTGGLMAAATLGLPEVPQGAMNWDYRYCWLRDATFALTALLNAGYREEAERWRDWILRAVAGRPDKLQIVYRADGGRRLAEYEADWLPGYRGAKPVRIGNAASGQTQLDVFGELMDSFHVAAKAGLDRTQRGLEVETALVEHLEGVWDQPGADIWENRGEPHRYTYSQAMAWVGVDRFLKSAETLHFADDALVGRLRGLCGTIHHTVCERGFSASRGHFVQHYGSEVLDASLLLLPLVGFLPADDPRMAGTIAAIERELMDGGLVRRKAAKGDGSDEGAFLACSCWMADCMKMQGREDEAAAMLERVIGLSNDVGLLSEEYHVPTRQLIGNIPQSLTHLGVVNTALFLSGPVIERGAG